MRSVYAVLVGIGVAACAACTDSNSMCKVAEDCANMCRTYDNNAIMYACEDGACKCVDEASLACDGDVTEKCKQICDRYQAGTVAACIRNSCNCLPKGSVEEKKCSGHGDCESHCAFNPNAEAVCVAETCACIDKSCTGDPSRDKCDAICTLKAPGKTASCVSQKCECNETVQKPESCTQASECAVYCGQIGQNQYYACVKEQCVCVDVSRLICTGSVEGECDEICATIAPGKIGKCESNKCECKEKAPDAELPADPDKPVEI